MSSLCRLLCVTALIAAVAGCGTRDESAPDFTLVSDAGQSWTLSAHRGRPVLLTFGFTHCSDTCPATLAKLAHLCRHALGTRGAGIEVVMVTVDPRRDTPPVLHAFVSRFDGPIVGLTGSPAQIEAVEAAYHVWAQSVPGRRGQPNYDVAHSTSIYLIDAGGRVRGLRDDDDPEAAIARAVRDMVS
ncbi:MAG: SCO family protein [Candidatus Tumulicola sp.]